VIETPSSPNPAHPLGWLPNFLTLGRILMIPLLVAGILLMAKESSYWLARPSILITLFVLAVVTDFFDGFLARRWHVVSDFGRMIDPIADKLLVAGCLIAFAIATNGAWFLMVPGVLLFWLATRSLLPIDSLIPPFIEYSGTIGLVLIWIAAILSVYTGSLYLRAALGKGQTP